MPRHHSEVKVVEAIDDSAISPTALEDTFMTYVLVDN